MSRKVIDRNSISSNTTIFSSNLPITRGVDSNVFICVELSGAVDGENVLNIVFQASPNPSDGDNAEWFDESDSSAFPTIRVDQDQASSAEKYKVMVHIKGDYNTSRFKMTRSGTGNNVFQYSVWVEP